MPYIWTSFDPHTEKLRSVCPYYHVLKTTLGTTNADLTGGNRLHDLFDNGVSTPALLQRAITNKRVEELGKSDLSMTSNCLMSEDISIADEGGDRVEDGKEAESILPILRAAGKGSAINAKMLAKRLKGKGKSRRSETFHKVQDNIIQMMLEVIAADYKGRMEFAAFQADAAREAREAQWKMEDERNSQVRAMEIVRMQIEIARYREEAALRNAEARRMAEEHEMNIVKRKREEEKAMEDRNIKRTNAIQARTMWLMEFAKKDADEAEK
ncbi:hypothetical protein I314_02669 [Cryptococcus bacillisporus CA1873]|uniref:Uncharacterized protein n=1 Tax=Cryptococcus bacillisporus CA1873 TaxID=1296111 RepID=A0ABR5BD11_CRYGA|nr:hypothetical protein I314_02669 [Cryptococcus bacillisporus CA1873]|eukprot:KIR63888.1 hypothetical protein I314_02669 [Cryptococcus gattii CA1873]